VDVDSGARIHAGACVRSRRSWRSDAWQSERAARETSQPKAGVRRDGVDAARTLLSCTRRGRELTRREVIALTTEQQRTRSAGALLRFLGLRRLV
jgi:hypothetical protein